MVEGAAGACAGNAELAWDLVGCRRGVVLVLVMRSALLGCKVRKKRLYKHWGK